MRYSCPGAWTLMTCGKALVCLVLAVMLAPAMLRGEPVGPREGTLDLRQFRLEGARVPGMSARQNVVAWVVEQGQWQGQNLDGLSLLLVEQASSDGQRVLVCYVTATCTLPQRNALLEAVIATQPQYFPSKSLDSLRIEPALIRWEIEGQAMVLHLALVS